MRRLFVIAGALLVFGGAIAFADSAANAVAIDTVWTLMAAVLVFLMQAGFAMLETGFTRAKNAANIMMKNLMDFSLGSLAFWAVGFGIMFGADAAGLIGTDKFFLGGAMVDVSEGSPISPSGCSRSCSRLPRPPSSPGRSPSAPSSRPTWCTRCSSPRSSTRWSGTGSGAADGCPTSA